MNHSGKPRLLVLTSTYPRWPDDHEPPFVHELACRMADRFEVTVLAPHAPGAKLRETMQGVDVRRFRYAPQRLEKLAYEGGIPTRLKRQPWLLLLVPSFLLAQLAAAARLVRELDPEVIHAHWIVPSGLTGAIVKELLPGNRRLLITAHGADIHVTGPWPLGALKRLATDSADTLTVVSHALRERVAPLVAKGCRVEVAPMGVDLKGRFTPADELVSAPIIVSAGRLVEKKGVADLLRAMPAVLQRLPEAQLLIAGHGPLEATLRAMVTELQLSHAVEFLGSIPNAAMPDVFRRGRVAVFPFRTADDGDTEGLGLVVVEAMGCGLPVIVGDVPAVHDLIRDGESGTLVPSQNPHALAEAITKLLSDPLLSKRQANGGRAFALAHFDWEQIAARYHTLLSSPIDPA